MTYLGVFIGGGLGCLARFALSAMNREVGSLWFAAGTFSANFISCLVLGYILGMHEGEYINPNLKLMLAVGFCGGFSTFSTFSLEVFTLVTKGYNLHAAAYILASIAFGIFGIIAGTKLSLT